MTTPVHPFSAPLRLDDVPEEGRHIHLVADAAARGAIAALAGLRSLERLEANFAVLRHGPGGMRITGTVTARVGQDCVVTLEPVDNDVTETVDVTLLPTDAATTHAHEAGGTDDPDAPDVLIDGTADLGAIATEFLLLGIDPYPRKPGASYVSPPPEPGASPFAALAKLKPPKGGR